VIQHFIGMYVMSVFSKQISGHEMRPQFNYKCDYLQISFLKR